MASGASISRSWLCGMPGCDESPASLNRLNESLLGGPQTPGQSGMPGRLHQSSVSRIEPVFHESLLKTRIGRATTKNAIHFTGAHLFGIVSRMRSAVLLLGRKADRCALGGQRRAHSRARTGLGHLAWVVVPAPSGISK